MHGMTLVQVEALARLAHAAQVDEAGRPYTEHLGAVVMGVADRGGSYEQIAAAWLHEAVEDGVLSEQWLAGAALPQSVKDMILALIERPGEPLEEYAARILATPGALLVKESDLAHQSDPRRLALLSPAARDRLTAKYAHIRGLLELPTPG
jgi:hypothetical protein